MQKELIQSLTKNFESHAQQTENGVEFWLARDLQHLLGYTDWRNFLQVVNKAKTACEVSGQNIPDHFVDANKMVDLGSGSQREVPDIMLTRYACYLIAQNGDSRKEDIAFAQTYFAVQTRKLEIIERRLLESERLSARKKLSETEKELSSVIFEQTGGEKNFALIRSKGDQALFAHSTQQMKSKWHVPKGRALADFAPTIILKAKDFATEITIFNARENGMNTEREISSEHITNNTTVRKALLERGIRPENLPPEDDIKKVERKLASEEKKSLRDAQKLND
ncbi:DNA damage-inducible protein D [Candidatus Peregrinibacteria bacterium]|nr:DNA damage-inducible protein D [Candidatus Peregrinibacteria bacterium]